MKEKETQQFTAQIADIVPSIRFQIKPEEEFIYRKAVDAVNKIWSQYRAAEPRGDARMALAKTALAFAELYYRRDTELKKHINMVDDFEKDLDDILLNM